VFAGAGGGLGHGVATARAAADAGADGLLLMPPYLTGGTQDGLVAWVEAIVEAADRPVIVYQRSTVRLEPTTAVRLAADSRVIGLKDGSGDIERMQRIVSAVRAAGHHGFTFFNGLPTAEASMPAYLGLGVRLYSSAVFAFLPEVATAFLTALERDDEATISLLLREFYLPLVELRDRVPGYAVSLVKAGVALRGLDAGPVRPPLRGPSSGHLAELEALTARGLSLVRP
jgi:5-dehydro-4-deoxyglucarate dehydratase